MSQAIGKQTAQSSPVVVPGAQANQEISVPAVAGAEVQFQFDPTTATVARVDNSLVFTLDNGGKVTITDFFVTDGQPLPMLALPDGQVVPSEAVLAGLNGDMDLSTAAGPAARPPSSGGTSYEDGAGNLIGGTDRLGSLGTDFWGNTLGQTEVGIGTLDDGVTGRPTSDFLSGSGIGFERSPYDLEGKPLPDGAPNANVGDYTQQATQLTLTFTPLNGASLLSVSITLPEGIGLSINGAAPVYGTITVLANQIGNLVLITPPYSDANFQVSVTPTVADRFGGLHTLAPVTAEVVMDAVAQRPEDVAGTLVDDGNASHVMTESLTKSDTFVDGKDVTEHTVTTTTTEGRVNVSLTVSATFQDFDGTEQHVVLVEKLPGFDGAYSTIEINGVTYFQIPVTNADLIANNGTVKIPVSLTAPQTTTDTDFSVRTGAMATETPSDSELREDNNVATVINPETVNFKIDVINSTLTVETGWASEGGDADKNLPTGRHDADWISGDVHEATKNGDAPISLSIAGGAGSSEVIDSVTFTYDASRGTLDYTGPGTPIPGTDANGNATLTITGVNSPDLTGLVFKPATTTDAQYNSDDVKLEYKVTVTNDKGASATFSGSSIVAIDAVADRSSVVEADIDGTGGSTSLIDNAPLGTVTTGGTDANGPDKSTGWETDTFQNDYEGTRYTVKVHVATTFADLDGSEKHYILVEQPTSDWSLGTLPQGYTDAGMYTGSDSKIYFKIEVDKPDQASANAIIPLQTGTVTGDMETVSIKTGSLAEEQRNADSAGNHEYDKGNNAAERLDGTTVSYGVDVINATLKVETGWTSESGDANKNQASADTHTPNWDGDSEGADVSGATNTTGGAPINLSIGAGAGSTEVIDSVTFTYDGSRGALNYTGPGRAIPGTDASGKATLTITGVNSADLGDKLVFNPATTTDAQYDSDDVTLDYKVTVKNGEGASATFSGSSTIVMDAVADLPTNVNTGVAYDGNADNTAGRWGSAIDVKVNATFSDYKDGSENHYLLVEAREGWSCSNATGTVTLEGVKYYYKEVTAEELKGTNGAGEFTFKLTAPTNPGGTLTGDAKIISEDGSITLKSGSLAVEGKIDGTQNGQVVPSGEDREWDLGNNVAFAGKDTTIDFNVINSEDKSEATAAYEDHKSKTDWQMPGNANVNTDDGNITLSLPVARGEHITNVTLTFNFAGTQPGTFTYDGNTYTPIQGSDGKWTLTLPAGAVQAAGDDTSVTLRYNPPANDDTDLTNLNYSMNVKANTSDATGTHKGDITSDGTSTTGTLIVDAVADPSGKITSEISANGTNQGNKLVEHADAVTVDGNRNNSPATTGQDAGWEKDTFNAQAAYKGQTHTLVVSVKTDFPDTDDSETHTLLVQKPATGTWSVDTDSLPDGYSLVMDSNNKPILYDDGKGNVYFQIKVDASGTPGNSYDGKAEADITLKVSGISGDLNTTIKTGAISQEGAKAPTEIDMNNNTATRTDGSAPNYVIDVINSTLTVRTGWASEGNNDAQHLGTDSKGYAFTGTGSGATSTNADKSNNGAPIQISISGNSGISGTTSEYISSITISHPGVEGNLIYKGIELVPGMSSTVIGGNTVTFADGKFTITFGNNTTTSLNNTNPASVGSDLVYRPNANSDSDTDVNLDYSVTVKNGAGAQATFSGSSTVVVDAVADKPDVTLDADMGKVVDYQIDPTTSKEQTAARPGENVKVNIESVKFGDYKDGSESHSITLNKTLTSTTLGQPNATTSIATGQTITLTGKDAGGGTVTQTIVFGDSAANSTITIKGANYQVISSRAMTDTEYNAMASSADGYSNFKIPVLNDFLKLTNDGTVSTSFDIKAPSSSVNTTYEAKVGGFAKEEATTGGELDKENGNYKGNNESLTAEKVKFDVNPVTSTPKVVINLVDSKVYENDTPHANLPGNTEKGGGANINISGIDAGETATIELTFSLKDGKELTASANDGDVMRIEYGDKEYPATYSTADGKWHVTVDVKGANNGDAADGVLTFKPGSNYNSSDIHVDYNITVRDNDSGQAGKMVDGVVVGDDANPWQNHDSTGGSGYQAENKDMGILVDAVAQAPDINDVKPDYTATGGSNGPDAAFVSGKDVALRADITFEDYKDGSEKHYMLVEAKAGWEAPTSIKIFGSDNKWHEITPLNVCEQKLDVNGVKTMYYLLEIPNKMIEDYGTDGKIDAQIWMKSPSGAGDTEFKVGAIANEDANKFNNTTNVDFDKGNNTSIVIKETPVKIHFDNATGAKLSIGNTYEDLNSQQNTSGGQAHKDNPGSIVFTSNNAAGGGDDEVLTEVTISFKNPEGTVTLPGGIIIDSSGHIDSNGLPMSTTGTTTTITGSDGSTFVIDQTGNSTNITVTPGTSNTKVEVNYTPDANSDEDFKFDYSTKTLDPSSGDTASTSGSSTVVVDAVADLSKDLAISNPADPDKPLDFEMDHKTKIPGGDTESEEHFQTIHLKVAATFPDHDDSENHYILIEVTANSYVSDKDGNPITNADGTPLGIFYGPGGTRYYKVPVADNEIDPNNGSVSKEISITTYSRMFGHDGDAARTIKTGALAEEQNSNRENTADDRELNINNNTAFTEGSTITVHNKWPGGHTLWIDPAYENNTPHANEDKNNDGKPDEEPGTGGKMYFGSVVKDGPPITEAKLTMTADGDGKYPGTIVIRDADGNVVATHVGPTVTLDIADLENKGYNAYFVPNHNYSDKDVDMGYTLSDGTNTTGPHTFPIIIDAVAQMPEAVDYNKDIASDTDKYGEWQTNVDYGNDGQGRNYTAMGTIGNGGNEGTVKITVGGGSLDKDGSEQRYALLEDTGEFTIKSPATDGTIYLYDTTTDDSGKTWIKIPIPQGKTSVDIEIELKNPSSRSEHVIRTGIMTEEQNAGTPDNYEADAKNNIAYDLSGTTVINVSTVDSSASVAIPSEIKENEGFDLVIKGECSTTDTFNSLTITHTGSGKLTFSGGTDYDGMYTYTGGTLTITNRVLLEALNNGKVKFSFTPNPYDDADVTWNWKSSFTDTLSGDTSGLDESKTTVVDAVAQVPDVDHTSFGSADGTHEAAMRSGEAVIKSTVTFKDLDGSEKHYIVLEQDGDWTCKGVTVNNVFYGADKLTTMFSENGTPYYALKVTNDMLNNGVAEVEFTLNAPDKNSDVGGSLKIGGISVEETTGAGGSGGKETDLANNWSQGLEDAKVGMAIVETDKVDLVATGELKEDDPDGVALSLTGVKVQNTNGDQANDEIITKTTFTVDQAGTPAGTVIGKITYNNVDYPVEAGGTTTIDFGDTGFDSSKGPRFVLDANNHNNGAVTINTESTVVDTKSGDSKTFTDTDEITVTATADAPTNIEVTGPSYTTGTTAVGAGKSVTFEVSATFADTDGSEQRFILVEKKDDWGNPKGYGTVTENGTTYYKVPVYRTDGGPVDVTLTTPSNATDDTVNLKVGGMAVENSNPSAPKFTFEDDHVSVNIGVVDTTAVTGSGQGDEDDAAGAAITLTADGKNEAITKVVFTAPTSGEIWYNGAAVTAVNGKITIDNFDTTKLEYHPAANFSGSVDLSYTATVQDNASGASKEFGTSSPLTVTITINPLNDAPEIGDNTRVFDPTDLNLSGQLVFSDVDMAHEGDTLSLWVNGTLVTGEEYTRFEGENGDLSINGKGEYTYTPHEGTSPADLPAGVLDEFGFKVVDSYGVSSAGNLEISLGSDSLHIEDVNGAFKIYGSSHSEEITGSTGNDTVFAFDGDDTIHGGAGHDYIHGGAGDDIIYGGEGDDTIYGGEGNDLIFAGKGDDVLFGGAGADTFSWTVGDHDNGTDTIHGFSAAEGDKLCIGIMAQDGEVLSLHDVLDSGNNDIDVYLEAEVNQTGITLHVNSGDVAQTIVIEMGAGAVAGYDNYQSFVEQFQNTQDEEAQSAMVQHLLSTITC